MLEIDFDTVNFTEIAQLAFLFDDFTEQHKEKCLQILRDNDHYSKFLTTYEAYNGKTLAPIYVLQPRVTFVKEYDPEIKMYTSGTQEYDWDHIDICIIMDV